MIVEVMPVACVGMLGRSRVMSVECVADMINYRVQIVHRVSSTAC